MNMPNVTMTPNCAGLSAARTTLRRARAPGLRSDRGAVTVEAALALGTLALVTALAVGAVATVGAAVRCTDAARELARLTARGEPARGRAVAAQLAPSGARIALTIRGDEATAEVTAAPVAVLPVNVTGRAVAVLEPDSPLPAEPAVAPAPNPNADSPSSADPAVAPAPNPNAALATDPAVPSGPAHDLSSAATPGFPSPADPDSASAAEPGHASTASPDSASAAEPGHASTASPDSPRATEPAAVRRGQPP
jgi:hypothetical protein